MTPPFCSSGAGRGGGRAACRQKHRREPGQTGPVQWPGRPGGGGPPGSFHAGGGEKARPLPTHPSWTVPDGGSLAQLQLRLPLRLGAWKEPRQLRRGAVLGGGSPPRPRQGAPTQPQVHRQSPAFPPPRGGFAHRALSGRLPLQTEAPLPVLRPPQHSSARAEAASLRSGPHLPPASPRARQNCRPRRTFATPDSRDFLATAPRRALTVRTQRGRAALANPENKRGGGRRGSRSTAGSRVRATPICADHASQTVRPPPFLASRLPRSASPPAPARIRQLSARQGRSRRHLGARALARQPPRQLDSGGAASAGRGGSQPRSFPAVAGRRATLSPAPWVSSHEPPRHVSRPIFGAQRQGRQLPKGAPAEDRAAPSRFPELRLTFAGLGAGQRHLEHQHQQERDEAGRRGPAKAAHGRLPGGGWTALQPVASASLKFSMGAAGKLLAQFIHARPDVTAAPRPLLPRPRGGGARALQGGEELRARASRLRGSQP